MAQITTHKCISCGAPLPNAKGGKYTCPFCGTINFLELDKRNENELNCPECGAVNPKDALHCSACGMKFTITCPRCGQINKAGVEFCTKCGVKIQEEILRQRNTETQRALQITLDNQRKAKKAKKTTVTCGVILAVFLCLAMMIIYQANFTPKAHARQTATQEQVVLLTQTEVDKLSTQYPYHYMEDDYNIFITQTCVMWSDSHDYWWLLVKSLVLDPHEDSVNYEDVYIVDNFGNTTETGYESNIYGTASNHFYGFNHDSTNVTVYFTIKGNQKGPFPVEVDLTDPRLQVGCAQ